LSFLLSVLCVAGLALFGCRPYVDEFRGRIRQTLATFLLVGILAVVVFLPVTSFGDVAEIDPDTLWAPALLVGHVVILAFLATWWALRGDELLARFLHLSSRGVLDKIRQGVATGCFGWVLTILITSAAAAAFATSGHVAEPTAAPPIMVWLAALPWRDKLMIVVAAMTVEEAFFRGFLQPRVGLLFSSVLFALSHFSYGLPFMIVGVFAISLVIGRTFARSADLLPCIIAHGVFDGVQLFIVLPLAVRMLNGGSAVLG